MSHSQIVSQLNAIWLPEKKSANWMVTWIADKNSSNWTNAYCNITRYSAQMLFDIRFNIRFDIRFEVEYFDLKPSHIRFAYYST